MFNFLGNVFGGIFNNIGGFFGGIFSKIGWGIVEGKVKEVAINKGNDAIDDFFDIIENLRDENLKKIPAEELAVILKYMKNIKTSLVSGEDKFDIVVYKYIQKFPEITRDVAEAYVQNIYDETKELFDL